MADNGGPGMKVCELETDTVLLRALHQAKDRKMTAQEVEEQRVSFIVSSVSEKSHVTREQIRELLNEREGF